MTASWRANGRTIVYVNPREDGAQLDFRTEDVLNAPAKMRKPLDVKGTRARLRVNGKNVPAARGLLKYVAEQKAAS